MGRPIMPQPMHVLALAGALCSAAATIFIRQGLRTSDPFSGFWINLLVGTISLWVAVLVTGGVGRLSGRGALLFLFAGLIRTVGARLLRVRSIERDRASIAAALVQLHSIGFSNPALALL